MGKEEKNKTEERLILGLQNNDILLENEKDANRILAVAGQASLLMLVVVWLLSEVGIFYVYLIRQNRIIYLVVACILLLGPLIGKKAGFDKPWMKYHLMGTLILAFAFMDVVYSYNVPILAVIPMVLSARYFSKRYTVIISLITLVVFFISTLVGAFIGDLDLNCLELPAETVLSMEAETWIYDVIFQDAIYFDRLQYVKDVILYRYLVILLQSMIVSAICIAMSTQGRRLIMKQKALAEQSAKTGAELTVAAKIQADVLPSKFPAFPKRQEFDIYASMTPAKEVGGDFYDFFLVDEDHLYLCIADVSGKGIPAAMFMMAAKNILAEHARMGKTPAQILQAANKTLCINNKENMFVTVWVGLLQISTGILTAASAGHEYPAIKTSGGTFQIFQDEHGFPLGWFDTTEYEEYELHLAAGSMLFTYTDGVTEAMDAKEQMFGAERMLTALNQKEHKKPEEVLESVRLGVSEFVQESEQFDDLTMLCLVYY